MKPSTITTILRDGLEIVDNGKSYKSDKEGMISITKQDFNKMIKSAKQSVKLAKAYRVAIELIFMPNEAAKAKLAEIWIRGKDYAPYEITPFDGTGDEEDADDS